MDRERRDPLGSDVPESARPARREVLACGVLGAAAFACGGPAAARAAVSGQSAAPEGDRDAALARQLAANAELDYVMKRGGSNHASMALCALHALGGSAEQIEAQGASALRQVGPLPAERPPLPESGWRGSIGQRGAFPALLGHFERRVAELGRDGALREALPDLLPGLAGFAFHGAIRTAYAVRFAPHFPDREIAVALAFWAATHEVFGGEPRRGGGEEDPLAVLDAARRSESLAGGSENGGSVLGSMYAGAARDGFAEVAAQWKPGTAATRDLARAGAHIYLAEGTLNGLHMLTGAQALEVLAPYVADPAVVERSQRACFQAQLAVFVTAGMPRLEEPDAGPRAWDELRPIFAKRSDSHDLKLADAARELERAFGPGPWRACAERRLRG